MTSINNTNNSDSDSDSVIEKTGDIIRKQREAKNISIEYIFEKTKISKKFIKAIEESNYAIFPGDIYLYGFIVNICELIDLDPKEILKKFEEERNITHYHTKYSPSFFNKDKHNYEKLENEAAQNNNRKNNSYRAWLIPAVLALVFLVILIINPFSEQKTQARNQSIEGETIPLEMNENKKSFAKIKENTIIKIYSFGDSLYKLQLKKIAGTSCLFSITGDNLNSEHTLNEGDKLELDLDNDEVKDFRIKLKKISGDLTFFYLEKIKKNESSITYRQIWQDYEHIIIDEDYYKLFSQIPENTKNPIKVYVEAGNLDSHISYTIDGKKENKRNMKPGEYTELTAKNQLQLQIGNYRHVILIINDKPINLQSESDSPAITKIVKWDKDPDNETMYNLIIKDAN
ncbi:MAG TPA: RodZ domain-containing protein [Spirochaetota bacterium]|nr:RodZ domain-containing protein [Spirochaetota bacterium]